MKEILELTKKYLEETLETNTSLKQINKQPNNNSSDTFFKKNNINLNKINTKNSVSTSESSTEAIITFDNIETLKEHVVKCEKCVLSVTKKNDVKFGKNLNSKIMILTNYPSFSDELNKEIFNDNSRELFTKILKAINLNINDIYITPVIKCTPKKVILNDYLKYKYCFNYILNEIKLIKPKYILGFGNVTFNAFYNNKSFKENRGKIIKLLGINAIFTYHPSDLLIDESLKKIVWDDLKQILNNPLFN